MSKAKIPVRGSCHCGAVEYEIRVNPQLTVHKCNCSICSMSGYTHLIVAAKDFHLTSGKSHLTDYRFNTRIARHLFCSQCGIKSFYVPRSNPDGFSANLNCLDLPEGIEITVEEFDGQNWELNAGALQGLSKKS